MKRRAYPLVLVAAAASAAAVTATAVWSRHWDPVTVAVVLAAGWGAIVSAVDAFVLWPRTTRATAHPVGARPVTFLVRLADEQVDIARTSLVLAAEAGPVVVVATRHSPLVDELARLGIREHVAPTTGEALQAAAREITSDAVLVLSASAFPVRSACERAAARLTDDVGWVSGRVSAFNNDRYAPGERELIGARAREHARDVGLVTWEPDATIVRTSLLRSHPLPAGQPDGTWLRARSAEGWRGVGVPDVIARRAAPADAPIFWPMQTRRQRGTVADLADAATTGGLRARGAGLGALLRELYAYPTVLWLLAIVLIGRSGRFPFQVAPVAFFALHGSVAAARWVSSRLAYGIGLHPVDEARAAAYDLPTSMSALPSALTRRVRPNRVPLPDQPLAVAALLLTIATTIPLLDRHASASSAGLAVGLTLGALGVTWVFALRAIGAGAWDRATYRLGVDFAATIEGQPARVFDASPSGLAVIGAPATLRPGSTTEVTVDGAATSLLLRGRVTDVRHSGGRTAVGVALDLDPEQRVSWIRALFHATGSTDGSSAPAVVARPRLVLDRERAPLGSRARRWLAAVGLGAVSVVVLGVLLLAFLGFRPMVVRSGSMRPTLRVGDIVVAEWTRADRLRVGDIVTFVDDADGGRLVTHRVQQVRRRGRTVEVETKGDANVDPEHWTARRDALVGRVEWTIPRVGGVLIVLGESTTRWVLLAVAGLVVVVAAGRWRHARRRRRE